MTEAPLEAERPYPRKSLASFFEASREHRPMSGLDEFMIHNHPHPVRVMWTGDSQAYERIWFTSQDQTGDLMVTAGTGMYPNLGTTEAFVIVNCRGLHTTVRAHRKMGDNRMDMTVGPITSRWCSRSASGASYSPRTTTASASISRGSTPSAPSTASSVPG